MKAIRSETLRRWGLPLLALLLLLASGHLETRWAIFGPEDLFETINDFQLRSVCFSLLIVGLAMLLPQRSGRWFAAIMIPLTLAGTIFQCILAKAYGLPVEKNLISIFYVSSWSETGEFVSGLLRGALGWLIIALAAALAALGAAFFKFGAPPSPAGRICGGVLLLPFLILSGIFIVQGRPREIFNTATLPRLALAHCEYKRQLDQWVQMANAPVVPPGLRRRADAPEVAVFVIGESATRSHWSLYGYPRATTPELDARRGELFAFTDVIAPGVHTAEVLNLAFSMAALREHTAPGVSLCELFRHAGYDVVLLSNQQRWGEFDTPINLLFRSAVRTTYLKERPDSAGDDRELPELLKAELSGVRRPTVFFLQLMGSHIPFRCRYAPGGGAFADDAPLPDAGVPPRLVPLVNQYDSTIRISDAVTGAALQAVEESGRPAVFAVFADHGEAMPRELREFRPRDPGERAGYEIPFVVWLSPGYRNRRPQLPLALERNLNAPFQTDRLLFTLLDLGGVEYDGFPFGDDLCSPEFRPRARYVRHGRESY